MSNTIPAKLVQLTYEDLEFNSGYYEARAHTFEKELKQANDKIIVLQDELLHSRDDYKILDQVCDIQGAMINSLQDELELTRKG